MGEARPEMCLAGGIIATATIEGHSAALIVSGTVTVVASVESVSSAAVVGAATAAAGLSLLALVLLLATPAAP